MAVPPVSTIVQTLVPQVLAALPKSWRGTTFNNSNLLGREVFAQRLVDLFTKKAVEGATPISTEDLLALGNAEDYLRVSSNISSTLEVVLALQRGHGQVERIFTFASRTMSLAAVSLLSKVNKVHLYTGQEDAPFDEKQLAKLQHVGGTFEIYKGQPGQDLSVPSDEAIVVFESAHSEKQKVDAIIGDSVLFVENPDKLDVAELLVLRKRMATPVTSPMAEAALQRLAGLTVDAEDANVGPSDEDRDAFLAHLQTLCGTAVNKDAQPVVFTAGLPTVASLFLTLTARGGANLLMCSTAYGGSSQLADLITSRTDKKLIKSTFDIQGDADIGASIEGALNLLASKPGDLLPTTVLFVEIPTNPDQKIPNLAHLSRILNDYQTKTQKEVLLIVDTTFAPGSQMMRRMQALSESLPVMVFISMSKSVSRGVTTAGTIVANHTPLAIEVLTGIRETANMLDTSARPDQMARLSRNHTGVEERCRNAYQNSVLAGEVLCKSVSEFANGFNMPLAFVSPEHAEQGFTSSTFSFNLPAPQGADDATKAGLAQHFVDLLTADELFKPCVSFGQDNGLVYCTVPATSTQGAIAEEDKAKQARGGVQLTRLSFPPSIDMSAVCDRIRHSVQTIYTAPKTVA